MADETSVNGQITDSVTQSNAKSLGEAPALALGNLYQAAAHSLSIAMQNATSAQQLMNTVAQAATAKGVQIIHSAGSEPGLGLEPLLDLSYLSLDADGEKN